MNKLRVLDLFSGIGAFSLGLERTGGYTTVAMCEIEPFAQRVLRKHWPHVPIADDIRTREFARSEADDDIGGFPCQDVSRAGLRAGLAGERSGLWGHLLRAIRLVRPQVAIVENVAALLDDGMGAVLGDLAEIGHDTEWHCISALSVGAEHERDRVWIISHPHPDDGQKGLGFLPIDKTTLQRAHNQNRQSIWLQASLPPPRVVDGSAPWVDRRERTEGLGNAVVPQIPELIGHAILQARAAA